MQIFQQHIHKREKKNEGYILNPEVFRVICIGLKGHSVNIIQYQTALQINITVSLCGITWHQIYNVKVDTHIWFLSFFRHNNMQQGLMTIDSAEPMQH